MSLKNTVYVWDINKNHSLQLKAKLSEATLRTEIENMVVLMLQEKRDHYFKCINFRHRHLYENDTGDEVHSLNVTYFLITA